MLATLCIDICTLLQQHLDDLLVASKGSGQESGIIPATLCIDLCVFSVASKSPSHGRALSPFAFDPFFRALPGFRPGVDAPTVAGLLGVSALVYLLIARVSSGRKGRGSPGAAEASLSADGLTSTLSRYRQGRCRRQRRQVWPDAAVVGSRERDRGRRHAQATSISTREMTLAKRRCRGPPRTGARQSSSYSIVSFSASSVMVMVTPLAILTLVTTKALVPMPPILR